MRLNYLAVATTGIVLFLIGGVWYMLFSRQWSAATGIAASQVGPGKNAYVYVVALAAALLAAYALARIIAWRAHPSAGDGAMIGILLGVLIFAPLTLMDYGFERRPLALFLVNTGYVVVALTAGGAILGAWRPRR